MTNKPIGQWAVRFMVVGMIMTLNCCREDNDAQNTAGPALSEVKQRLSASMVAGNLVSNIERGADGYTVSIEEEQPVLISPDLVTSITYDSSQWLVTFNFAENTSQSANFIGKLDIEIAEIHLDPNSLSPLSAKASFDTPVNGKFKVIVHGKPGGGTTVEHSFDDFTMRHELPVLGLYENYTNRVEFAFMNRNGAFRCSKTVDLAVASVNHPVLNFHVVKNQLPNLDNGLYLISDLRLATDPQGEVRWYYRGPGGGFYCKLRNGNFITGSKDNLSFYEVSMLGDLVKTYAVPNTLHHEIVEMPSGNFLVASHSPPGPPREDVVVEVSRSSGTVVKSWDFKQILDPARKTLPDASPIDWLHINAMYYDDSDNSFVISGRSQCAVVKVDYATSKAKWILGNQSSWNESLSPLLLRPIDASGKNVDATTTDFWQYGQHAVQRLPNGNLLLFDNGAYRGYYDNPNVPADSYTRAAEFKINEADRTVQLVWLFDNNKDVFTKITGYTQLVPKTESRLVSYMWVSPNTPRIVELDVNNNVVYEATINEGKSAFYRTLKVDLYDGMTLSK